jgi:2-(3-amino-3-carboxypropyl)histidine synthase
MYDLELNKAIKEIKSTKAKKVCIQLADGLKPRAREIIKQLKENTEAEFTIWAGSCYGACDVPKVKADLLIQFGHNEMLP